MSAVIIILPKLFFPDQNINLLKIYKDKNYKFGYIVFVSRDPSTMKLNIYQQVRCHGLSKL